MLRNLFLCLGLLGSSLTLAAADFYFAPKPQGGGDGKSAENAAGFLDRKLWEEAVKARRSEPVTVHFAPGVYLIEEKNGSWLSFDRSAGVSEHLFTLAGAEDGETVFRRGKGEVLPPSRGPNLIRIRESGNLLIRNLHFRGGEDIGYALSLYICSDAIVEKCSFKGLTGAYYGAGGTARNSNNVVWRDSVFDHVGKDSHAHMLYNSYSCNNLTVKNCLFRDCSGDYVRFRDKSDFVVVEDCKFESTGKYPEYPFVSIPLFNNENPKEKPDPAEHEYFGTNVLVQNSTFVRPKPDKEGRGVLLLFHHSGYNPPGKQHLISRKEAAAFAKMTPDQAKAFLLERTGIDMTTVISRNNRLVNLPDEAIYESLPNYGSEKEFPRSEYKNTLSLTRLLSR